MSRQCLSKRKARYDELGEVGLLDRASVPHRSPTQLPGEVVAQIETWRRQHNGQPARSPSSCDDAGTESQ